jgi:hypothetical protein
MCDYSLHHVANRPAKIEDKLVTTKFHNSITRGFAAVGQPNVAVCLLPGTEIAFDENVECEPSFGIGILANKKIGQRLARFRQVNMDNPVAHHDALEFPDGQLVLVTRLCDGQRATVLQLPAGARAATAEETVVEPQLRESSLSIWGPEAREDGHRAEDGPRRGGWPSCRSRTRRSSTVKAGASLMRPPVSTVSRPVTSPSRD